jgi:hypothetical protein
MIFFYRCIVNMPRDWDPQSCWQKNIKNKKYFLDFLDCEGMSGYHDDEHSCKYFDDTVSTVAGRSYKLTFFVYYKIVGNFTRNHQVLKKPVISKAGLQALARCSLRKVTPEEIKGPVPRCYSDWPIQYNLPIDENKDRLLDALNKCIKKRIMFRDMCVIDCDSRISVKTHNDFLILLQILRAQLIVYGRMST